MALEPEVQTTWPQLIPLPSPRCPPSLAFIFPTLTSFARCHVEHAVLMENPRDARDMLARRPPNVRTIYDSIGTTYTRGSYSTVTRPKPYYVRCDVDHLHKRLG